MDRKLKSEKDVNEQDAVKIVFTEDDEESRL